MIITDVEAIVLDTGKNYPNPADAGEAHGVRFVSLVKISTVSSASFNSSSTAITRPTLSSTLAIIAAYVGS